VNEHHAGQCQAHGSLTRAMSLAVLVRHRNLCASNASWHWHRGGAVRMDNLQWCSCCQRAGIRCNSTDLSRPLLLSSSEVPCCCYTCTLPRSRPLQCKTAETCTCCKTLLVTCRHIPVRCHDGGIAARAEQPRPPVVKTGHAHAGIWPHVAAGNLGVTVVAVACAQSTILHKRLSA
jgi:hypothetical protein